LGKRNAGGSPPQSYAYNHIRLPARGSRAAYPPLPRFDRRRPLPPRAANASIWRGNDKNQVIPLASIPANAPIPSPALDRIVVVGTSGAGKSTLAHALASRLGLRHIELDVIRFLPGWVEKSWDQFGQEVGEATAGPKWVADGNYGRVRDLIWPRATTIIWLDYSFRIIFWRALRRTIKRVVKRESIHNGNRETIRIAFFSRYGIPWWVVRTYRLRRREFSTLLGSGKFAHARILIFTHPSQTERFLAELPATSGN
jgi:hypothetical protein